MVATLFSLLDTATLFRVVVPFYILTAMYESFIFFAFLAFDVVIFYFSSSYRCVVMSLCGLILNFPNE